MFCFRTSLAFLAVATLCAPLVEPLAAQRYTGTYSVRDQAGGATTLVLQELGGGVVIGSFARGGVPYRVDARIEDGFVAGEMLNPAGDLFFEAERGEYELWLTLFGTDASGDPVYDDFTEIGFTLDGSGDDPAGVDSRGVVASRGGVGSGSGGNPLAGATSDPYVGYFTDGAVTLEVWGGGGRYEGQITIGGATYPMQAQGNAAGIQGTLQAADGSYPLTAQLQGGRLILVSGGVQHYLTRDVLGGPRGGGFGGPVQGNFGAPGRGGAGAQGRGGFDGRGDYASPVPPGAGTGLWSGAAQGSAFTEHHIVAREWLLFLSGMHVSRLIGHVGGAATDPGERFDVALCSDRSFSMRGDGRTTTIPGRPTATRGQGRWTVLSDGETVVLLLEFRTGQVSEFRLQFADREPYANGSRITVSPAEVCR